MAREPDGCAVLGRPVIGQGPRQSLHSGPSHYGGHNSLSGGQAAPEAAQCGHAGQIVPSPFHDRGDEQRLVDFSNPDELATEIDAHTG